MPTPRQYVLTAIFTALYAIPLLALAQTGGASGSWTPQGTYTPLAPNPFMPSTIDLSGTGLEEYLISVFKLAIALAGVLAVVMIVVCGIKLMGDPSPSGKSEAKGCIQNAIFGLILAIGSWALLYTINPALVSTQFFANTSKSSVAPPPTPGTVTAPPPTTSVGQFFFGYKDAKGNTLNNGPFTTLAGCAAARKAMIEENAKTGLPPNVLPGTQGECQQVVPATSGAEQTARAMFAADNIYANRAACRPEQPSGCTNLANMGGGIVSLIKTIELTLSNPSTCTQSSAAIKEGPCTIVITGGSETGGHRTHGPGKDVADLRSTKILNDFLWANATKKAASFTPTRLEWNNYWFTWEGNHWHVCGGNQSSWYCNNKNSAGKALTCTAPTSGSGPQDCK